MKVAGYQRSAVIWNRNHWKIFEHVFAGAYLNVISFIKHEKDTATEVYSEPSQISTIEHFIEAATQRCSKKKVFWKYAANLQESTHADVWFQ